MSCLGRESLILPMMMYGKFSAQETVKDKDGKPIKLGNGHYKKKTVKRLYTRENSNGIFPSVNHMYVNSGRGGKRLAAGAEELKETWFALAKMWAKDNEWTPTKGEKVVVEMTPYFPNDKIKRDASNAYKLMMDALEEAIYDNDFYGLPRTVDLQHVQDGEEPYFKIDIYKKEEESDVYKERCRSIRISLPTDREFQYTHQ